MLDPAEAQVYFVNLKEQECGPLAHLELEESIVLYIRQIILF